METCLSVYVDFGRCVDKCCWAGLEIRGRKLAVSPLLLWEGSLRGHGPDLMAPLDQPGGDLKKCMDQIQTDPRHGHKRARQAHLKQLDWSCWCQTKLRPRIGDPFRHTLVAYPAQLTPWLYAAGLVLPSLHSPWAKRLTAKQKRKKTSFRSFCKNVKKHLHFVYALCRPLNIFRMIQVSKPLDTKILVRPSPTRPATMWQ